jgi:hypothetical protein
MGGPGNAYQWIFDDEILPDETMQVLTLPNVDATDGGVYRCFVSNAAGNDTDVTSVFISPYFIVQPSSTSRLNGDTVGLMCMAEAFPSPQYRWERMNGAAIRSGISVNSSILTFDPIMFGDEGDYFCTAVAGNGSSQSGAATITSKQACVII